MTLRELFDTLSSPAVGMLPPPRPATPAGRGSMVIRIDNPHGVPAQYRVTRVRRSGTPTTKVDVAERRVGVPTNRTIRLSLDDAAGGADHLITIRAAGRTSKLVLYRESLLEWLEGTCPEVGVSIAATGAVRFSVTRRRADVA